MLIWNSVLVATTSILEVWLAPAFERFITEKCISDYIQRFVQGVPWMASWTAQVEAGSLGLWEYEQYWTKPAQTHGHVPWEQPAPAWAGGEQFDRLVQGGEARFSLLQSDSERDPEHETTKALVWEEWRAVALWWGDGGSWELFRGCWNCREGLLVCLRITRIDRSLFCSGFKIRFIIYFLIINRAPTEI